LGMIYWSGNCLFRVVRHSYYIKHLACNLNNFGS
jgi:hypothetical protein